jgi:anti-sigma regulatory factor (Ser/Thr protein kinase)/CheY-like chemotaxis protein
MANQPNIFKSNLTLKFSDKDIENIYNASNKKCLRRNNIIYSSIFLIMSIIVLVILFKYKHPYYEFYMNMISVITTGILTICLMLTIPIKKAAIQNALCYVIYSISLINFILLRYFIDITKADNSFLSLVISMEILVRITWFQAGSLDFLDGFICTFVTIVIYHAAMNWTLPIMLFYRASIYAATLYVMLIIAYIYVKEKRKNFYLNFVLHNKNEWYNSVLENINSGFIQIENSKVTYMNQTFKAFFKNIKKYYIFENSTHTTENELLIRYSSTEDDIINNKSVSTVLPFIFNEVTSSENEKISYAAALKLLEEYSIHNRNKFCFLGTASYSPSNNDSAANLYFEVYGRCSGHSFTGKHVYEFIFNDVSRVKVIEEANAEVKFKTLFLSKVAHEFKNPILCVTELIDQIFDKIKSSGGGQLAATVNDLLLQVKSMSDYMLILIKDLDFFSQKQTMAGNIKHIELGYVKTKDIIAFCKNITTALIKKMQKQASIKFLIEEDIGLPSYLRVDEIKLKQILINLLSNSVKYTNYGSIVFSVSQINEAVQFSVKDTGKGISDIQKEKLFKPFSRDFNNRSTISAGLGLFIVKELTELIGSSLNYESKVDEGSAFWFSVYTDLNNPVQGIKELGFEDSFTISEETVVMDYHPVLIGNIYNIEECNTSTQNYKRSENSIDWELLRSPEQVNIILVDDEILPRQAALRLIKKFCVSKLINVNVLEGDDGIDCLSLFLEAFKNKVKIDLILSDETMNLLNGLDCANVLKKIYNDKAIEPIPFFILSAYESIKALEGVKLAFSKPLNESKLKLIFETIGNNLSSR